MKKRIAILTIILITLSVFVNATGCGDDTPVTTNQVVLCTGHPDWWPVMWSDANNNELGVGADLANKCLSDAGLQMSCTNMGSWSEILTKAKTGEIDVIIGSYWMAERTEYMYFTEWYLSEPVALVTKTSSNIVYNGDWDELKKIKLVGAAGATYGETFNQYVIDNNLNIVRVNNVAEAYNMLEAGTAEGFIYSYYSSCKHLSDTSQKDKFKIQDAFITEQKMHMCISKKSPYAIYLDKINVSIRKYREDGTIQKLVDTYLASLK